MNVFIFIIKILKPFQKKSIMQAANMPCKLKNVPVTDTKNLKAFSDIDIDINFQQCEEESEHGAQYEFRQKCFKFIYSVTDEYWNGLH